MRYVLENDQLTVQIDSHGAEIKSISRNSDNREYMWCGDEKYWGRTSPVLFPFVGAVRDKVYRHQNVSYAMGQHGFARDMEFSFVSKQDNSIQFVLKSNEDTLAKYPFDFALWITYVLDNNCVKVQWKVENTGSEQMYFSIGAHPAFMCPIADAGEKEEYAIAFANASEQLPYYFINSDGLKLPTVYDLKLDVNTFAIKQDSFNESAYIFENQPIKEVSLLNPEGKAYVTVKYDAPLLGIWSPERKHAPFVCIEPWYGRCDAADFTGELKDREYGNMLDAHSVFEAEYEMSFN